MRTTRQAADEFGTTEAVGVVPCPGVSEADYDRFFDLAELRCMETALSAARRLVSTSLGPKSEQFSHIASGLEKDIAARRQQMAAEYGEGTSTLEAGAISLRFAEANVTS